MSKDVPVLGLSDTLSMSKAMNAWIHKMDPGVDIDAWGTPEYRTSKHYKARMVAAINRIAKRKKKKRK